MLSERRDPAVARRFFKRAIAANGVPDRVVIDKSGANFAGLRAVNVILKFTGSGQTIEIRLVKYLTDVFDKNFLRYLTLNSCWPTEVKRARLRRQTIPEGCVIGEQC